MNKLYNLTLAPSRYIFISKMRYKTKYFKVDGVNSPTIIILPGELKETHITAMPSIGSEAENSTRLEFNWKKNSKLKEVDEDEISSEGQVE